MRSSTHSGVDNKGSVLLFQKVVPSYRVAIFRSLYEKFGVIVCHSIERKNGTWKSSYKQMDFPNLLLPGWYYGKSDTNMVQNIFWPLIKIRPRIIISEYALGYLSFWLLFLLRPVFRYKLAVWTHGVGNRDVLHPFENMRGKIDLFVYRSVDAMLLYDNHRKQIVAEHLGDDKKLFVAQNTLDTALQGVYRTKMEQQGKEKIKQELGFTSRFNLIYVGRLLKDKRIDLLLQAFILLAADFDVSLHIIGDGTEINLVNSYKKNCSALHTYGAIHDEETLGKYIFSSDLMVNPGYVGLSIVHAFAYGTPLVACRMTEAGLFHSPEIEYLRHAENGLLCGYSATSLAENIAKVLADEALLQRMSGEALKTAREDCSVEKMLSGFDQLIGYLQN